MLSSGAQTLVRAEKRGSALTSVVERSLVDMISEHPLSDRTRWQDIILTALSQIKAAAVSDTFPSAIEFAGAAIRLHARPATDSILPKPDVVRQLLASSDAPAAAATVVGVPDSATSQPDSLPARSSCGAVGRRSGSNTGVVCRNWAATSSCRFGSSCSFKDSHIDGGSSAVEQPRTSDAAPSSKASGSESAAGGSGVKPAIGGDSKSRGGRGRGRGKGSGASGGRGGVVDAS